MLLEYCRYNANIISRCLAFIEVNGETPDEVYIYLATRSQSILDIFGVYDFPFKQYDESTMQLQVYDVRTNKPVVVPLDKIECLMIPCEPNLLSPPIIGNPAFADVFTDRDIADIQQPFCLHMKEARDRGCFTTSKRIKDIELDVVKFREFTKTIGLEPGDEHMLFYLYDPLHAKMNDGLWRYMEKHKQHVRFARIIYIMRLCKDLTDDAVFKTFEDVSDFLKDPERVKRVWKAYLSTLIDKQVEKYKTEFEAVCQQHFLNDEQSREKDFIKLQYDKAIADVQQIDLEEGISKFGHNTLLMLRYVPPELDTPEGLAGVTLFTQYENAIITALYKNGIIVDENLFDYDGLDSVWRNYDNTSPSILDQLHTHYLEKIKEVRMEQIKRCSGEIVETVKKEAVDLDDEDINDIISSMEDFATFKERIDSFTGIADVLQYWPSVLLPLPPYVTRLNNTLQHLLDLQTLVETKI